MEETKEKYLGVGPFGIPMYESNDSILPDNVDIIFSDEWTEPWPGVPGGTITRNLRTGEAIFTRDVGKMVGTPVSVEEVAKGLGFESVEAFEQWRKEQGKSDDQEKLDNWVRLDPDPDNPS